MAILLVTGCDENYGWGWGFNDVGQLGSGSNTTTSTPVPVSTTGALATKGLVDISAGYTHTCALATDGTVACWGSNTYGELGAPVLFSSNVPVTVVLLPPAIQGKRITQVSAGNSATCVLASEAPLRAGACSGLARSSGHWPDRQSLKFPSGGLTHACVPPWARLPAGETTTRANSVTALSPPPPPQFS